MKAVSLKTARSETNIYRCPDCFRRFAKYDLLKDHVGTEHKALIPEDWSVDRYIFNKKYNKTHGSCVVDKKETPWNQEKKRYERYCSDKCKGIGREQFKKNCLRKLGTDNPAADPDHQIKAIKGRSYSGVYKFKDGGEVGYSSSYELDFLKFADEEMNLTSVDIEQCSIIFHFNYEGKTKFHIPDFYLPSYNLIIQIKDGGDNPNGNPNIDRGRQKLEDKAIIDNGCYNYIKIINKNYSDFIVLMKTLDERRLSSNNDTGEVIIIIPE